MQNITFKSNDKLENDINRLGIAQTMFTEWMKMNKRDPDARKLKYSEFSKKYVWKSDDKKWSPRCKGQTIGRTFLCTSKCMRTILSKVVIHKKKVLLASSNYIS